VDETGWIVFSVSLALIAFNLVRIRRTPQGRAGVQTVGRELTSLRSVRTWLVVLGALLSAVMTLILATLGNDGSVGIWVLVAGFVIVDLVFLRALMQRWRARVHA
jgi:hypothetical protein